MRPCFAFACLLAMATRSIDAHASHAIVPDDYPSIHAAIDSGADSVLVRDGLYPEQLSITRSVVLHSLPTEFSDIIAFDLHPRVLSISASGTDVDLVMSGLHILGAVSIPSYVRSLTVANCRIDSTIQVRVIGGANIRNNTIRGLTQVWAYSFDVSMNLVIAGTISTNAGGRSELHDNTIIGPADYGIVCSSDVYIRSNFVRGCVVGISAGCGMSNGLDGNLVEDCTGAGYLIPKDCGNVYVINNIARRCERGFDLSSHDLTLLDNTAEDCRADGILLRGFASRLSGNTVLRSGGRGIAGGGAIFVEDNCVIGSGSNGIEIENFAHLLRGNRVGHNAGAGIVAKLDQSIVASNTSYLNVGVGFDLEGTISADSIVRNISFANAVGLRFANPHNPVLSCNDWYGNLGGTVIGTAEGMSDTTLNPLFCDVTQDNVYLSNVSALVNLSGCGLIGARGVGCPYPAAANGTAPSPPTGLRVSPQPGGTEVRFTWRALEASAVLEVYDVTGARRWSTIIAPGESELTWARQDEDGRALTAGVYFARLTARGGRSVARVVLSQ